MKTGKTKTILIANMLMNTRFTLNPVFLLMLLTLQLTCGAEQPVLKLNRNHPGILLAQANFLEKVQQTSSKIAGALEAGKRVKDLSEQVMSGKKTNQPPANLPTLPTTKRADNRPSPVAAPAESMKRDELDELAWPILADGSLFLSARTAGEQTREFDQDTERLFGDGPAISELGSLLLHMAHGLTASSPNRERPTLDDAIRKSKAYLSARDDFERRDILKAVKPVFEQALAHIKVVTNVTAYKDYGAIEYLLDSGAYASAYRKQKWFDRSERASGTHVGAAFVDDHGNPWGLPKLLPFPADQAEQINNELKRNDEHLTLAVLIRGAYLTQKEFDETNPQWKNRASAKNTHLVVRITKAEAFAVFNPNSRTNHSRRIKSLGVLYGTQ